MLQITRSKICLVIATLGLLFSCGKDTDLQLEVTDIIPEPTEKVYSTIQGIILNEQEQVIQGAEIVILSQKAQTDENGFFQITDFFPVEGTPIRARKNGYFESNGIILPHADGITKVNIILVEKRQTEDMETGRIIHHQTDYASLVFPKDAFVHQDGTAFNGMVQINSQYFDPTHRAFAHSYPGFLKSKNLLATKALFPFGILKITAVDELSRSLAVNQEIQLTLEIPKDLIPFAIPQIPLWYLDKQTGFWVEEGTAQLEGTTYIGTVSHLTDWVAALGLDYVRMTGQITKEGAPFPFADVGVSYNVGSRFSFRSDEQGYYSLPIYTGGETYNINFFKTIDIDVKSNCGTILLEEKNIAPPTEDFTKDLAVSSSATFAIAGQVFCTDPDSSASDAYVLLQFDESSYQEIIPVDEQGQFEFFIEECGLSEVTLVGYDAVNLERSDPVRVTTTNTNVALNVCEAPFEPKVTFDLDGEIYSMNNCTVEIIDSIDYWHYQFKTIDSFPNFPEAMGIFVDYEINLFLSKTEGEDVPAYLWRYTISGNPTEASPLDIPYTIHFGTWHFDILSETEDQMIVRIPLGKDYPGNHGSVFKAGGEVIEVITGSVLLEASK